MATKIHIRDIQDTNKLTKIVSLAKKELERLSLIKLAPFRKHAIKIDELEHEMTILFLEDKKQRCKNIIKEAEESIRIYGKNW